MAQKTIDIEQDILGPIGSLKKDVNELSDKKITKFYASNLGETHIADSVNGLIQDMVIYGRSEQFTTTGKNLFDVSKITDNGLEHSAVEVTDMDRLSGTVKAVFRGPYQQLGVVLSAEANDTYTVSFKQSNSKSDPIEVRAYYYKDNTLVDHIKSTINESSNITFTFSVQDNGQIVVWFRPKGEYSSESINECVFSNIRLEKNGTASEFEPYTGGIPSPSPDYPQEIKSVVNPVINITGANILQLNDIAGILNGISYSAKNNVIKAKGIAKSRFRISLPICGKKDTMKLFSNNTYIFNPNPVKGTESSMCYLDFTNNKTRGFSLINNCIDKAILLNSNDTQSEFTFFIVIDKGAEIDMEWKPQLLRNEVLIPYEPYTEQTVRLPCTLNAIPVSSGGNVTVDGQQYVADRVVEKDGVFGIERNIREIHTNTKTMNNSEEYPGWREVEGISDVTYYSEQPVGTSRMLTHISNFTQTTLRQNNIGHNNIVFLISGAIGYSQSELIAKAIDVDMYIRLQDAIFEPLPGDIRAKLRALSTNYPVTNVSITSDQLDGHTVFNYPISMANGWNYVKQQLGDTREYIYDMQTQLSDTEYETAMAYVNSEYAVALAELDNM